MNEPWYSIVLAVHIFVALVGFGALAMTGHYAAKARRERVPAEQVAIRRYFTTGRNLAARALYLVPLLGGALLWLGGGQDVSAPYPWIGLFLWVVATGVATGALWPAEAELQELIASSPSSFDRVRFDRLAKKAARCSLATTVCFLLAVAVMIGQPG